MDYKKKYNEALKRAKAAIDIAADKDLVRGVVRTILPEFRESEDERIRKELKEAFEAYDIESKWNGIPIRSIFAWLEKQKEQKKKNVLIWGEPQVAITVQKQEWSEEDEEMLDSIIRVVCGVGIQPNGLREKQVSFLKSLRPQYHGDVTMTEAYKMGLEAGKASSWKPSEEQMEALNKARRFIPYNCDILESLYNQLKKL